MYIALVNHPRAQEYGIDSIRTCNSGSAPIPVQTLHEFEKGQVQRFWKVLVCPRRLQSLIATLLWRAEARQCWNRYARYGL